VSEQVSAELELRRWHGEKAIYHLVSFVGQAAEAISTHDYDVRLEFGKRRGFGSVKVMAQIGEARWKSSVFPQNKQSEWILLVSKKVMRAEDLAPGETITVKLELI